MLVEMDENGVLIVIPETNIEAYALSEFSKKNNYNEIKYNIQILRYVPD